MPRILLIEDDNDQRSLYRDTLQDAGFDVETAADARAGLDCAKKQIPDAVVLDIQMAGMDGIEALNKLMALNRGLPVVLYSAYPAFKNNFMTWAADAFVVKTGQPLELLSAVRELLIKRGVILPTEYVGIAT